ncbi:putative transcriptional regulator, ArsR family protein [Actinoplanes philippinensis]|uniref:ArsR family transcriptional regulator n=1 Tax=Actinoplanes philippinensis TaxID=35752 RepID=A0A1I2B8U8_9ACTN|nr:metalloregulator ArsR/SmtB family transcription factor [Actinoplanes philippinensis]GIE75764.1 putative transcriptional regulator, ArsR family protein [Actinoplanes philippinensis]SFE52584.1 ArsR family transcriptional regulator [Actinoplanes philippinensis]
MSADLVSPFTVADFNADDAGVLASHLRALADPARLRILGLLRQHGPMAGRDLVPLLGLAQPTVSHHLGILRDAGLIEDRPEGQRVVRVLCVDAITVLATLINPNVGSNGGGR